MARGVYREEREKRNINCNHNSPNEIKRCKQLKRGEQQKEGDKHLEKRKAQKRNQQNGT